MRGEENWFIATCGNVQPLGVGHDVEPPKLIQRVDPHLETRGIVIIQTVLTDKGEVCAAQILRGLDPQSDRAALEAVKQWRFTPAKLNGQPRYAFFALTVH